MDGRRKLAWLMGTALACGVAGCDGAASHTPTDSHSGTSGGHGGGQHALGEDPKGELSRIKKAGGSTPTPGRLPGR